MNEEVQKHPTYKREKNDASVTRERCSGCGGVPGVVAEGRLGEGVTSTGVSGDVKGQEFGINQG